MLETTCQPAASQQQRSRFLFFVIQRGKPESAATPWLQTFRRELRLPEPT